MDAEPPAQQAPTPNAAQQISALKDQIAHLTALVIHWQQAEADKARLLVLEREQRLLAESLVEAAAALTSRTSRDQVLDLVLDHAQRLVPCATANLMLLEDKALRAVRWRGYQTFGCEDFIADLVQPLEQISLDAQVVQSRQPLVVHDTRLCPEWVSYPPTAWIRSYLALPICLKDQPLGLLRLDSDVPGRFTQADAQRLAPLANVAAVALENARLLEASQRQAQELEALVQVTRDISALRDLDTLLRQIVEWAVQLLNGTAGSLFLLRPEQDRLEEIIVIGEGNTLPGAIRKRGQGFSGKIWETGQPLIVDDYSQWPGRQEQPVDMAGMSVVGVPIQWGDQFLGVLTVDAPNQERRFNQTDAALLSQLAVQAAIAIQNARLISQLEQHISQVQLIMDTVPDGMVLLDNTGRVVMANPAGRRYLADLAQVSVGDHLSHLGDQLIGDFLAATPEPLPREVTIPQTDPDRSAQPRVFEATARPLQAGNLPGGWVLIIREVTRERELHQRAEEQERLAAVGQLAAGIAHDFNNILQVIIGFAELLLLRGEVSDPVKRDLERISQQGQRAGQLVRQLLDFARRSVSVRQTLDVQTFLEGMLKWLRRAIPEHIRIYLEVTPGRYLVSADSAQLEQALTNLAVNARDAMPEGGELRLSLAHLVLQPGEPAPVGCPDLPAGDWIALTLSDTGTGIAPDVLPHIFEPFFTTKPIGKGTGLGLAQVFGIVKQHMGYIGVVSQPGRGTTFTVYLPALRDSSEAGAQPTDREQMPLGHGQLIMLVEDDDIVREATQSMLEYLNYRVLPVSDGHTALELYARHVHEISLVLTDMTMPELSGLALAEKLHARYPEARLLAMTGYAMDVRESDLQASGFAGWLYKPLDIGRLAHAICRAIGS